MTPVTPEDSKSKNNHDDDVFYDAEDGGENKTPAVIEGSIRISSVTTPSSGFEAETGGSQRSKSLGSELPSSASSPSSLHENRVKMINELSSSKKFT